MRGKKFLTIKVKNHGREGVPKYCGWIADFSNVNNFIFLKTPPVERNEK